MENKTKYESAVALYGSMWAMMRYEEGIPAKRCMRLLTKKLDSTLF